MAQTHVTYSGTLRKCDLEGMSWFLSDHLHEAAHACYQAGKRHWLHLRLMEKDLYLKFPPQKDLLYFGCLLPKVSTLTIFAFKT